VAEQSLVVDTCVAINLLASQRWRQILAAGDWLALMPDAALAEVLYIFDNDGERRPASLEDQISLGDLTRCTLSTDEVEVMISLAADLGKGEAAAIAVSAGRGLALATDDKAARRHQAVQALPVVTTPNLLRQWAGGTEVEATEISQAIGLIESRSNFRPRRNDSDFTWWDFHRPGFAKIDH
jgi:hypothetical protein